MNGLRAALLRLCIAFGGCAAGYAAAAHVATPWPLLPAPAQVAPAGVGTFEVADGAELAVEGADAGDARFLADHLLQLLDATGGPRLRVAGAHGAAPAIRIVIDPRAALDEAGYRLRIEAQGILVQARTPRGAFYGETTLWQLLTPPGHARGAAVAVAQGAIEDAPRFAWRALLLDSARHYQRVAEIERLIDAMALAKLDVLLWHLTDDQGWRLQVPGYPELTRIGACRPAAADGSEPADRAGAYCGSYSDAQIRQIVRYAARRYIEVVPEIDMPGHAQAAIAAYPWLGVSGRRPAVWTDWGVSAWLLAPNARTLRFVDAVLAHATQLFPSRYVSFGGDEADHAQWDASPAVQAQRRALGLTSSDQLQGWFMARVADRLRRRGRVPVGWDDAVESGAPLPASQVVMSWHGQDHERVALAALRQGHQVVIAPQESLYFDHVQSALADEWPGPPPVVSLRQAYDTAVIPEGASEAEARRVLGVQGALWTEQMPSFAHVQHALFPRLAALAELAWSPASSHDWDGFLARLPATLARERALGIADADSAFAPVIALEAQADGRVRAVVSNQVQAGAIRYTTDGSTPDAQAPLYTAPLLLAQGTTLRVATFGANGQPLASVRRQQVDRQALRTRAGSALATCSGEPPSRLSGAVRAGASPPGTVYSVEIGNGCWRWPQAPLDGARRVALAAGRVTWRFGDEAKGAVVRRRHSPAGEFELHTGGCDGPLLARLPLDHKAQSSGLALLEADLILPDAGRQDLCIFATGDPRLGQWALAKILFSG